MSTEWEVWRAERTETLLAPHGWLSLTAFHWLPGQPGRLEGLPGLWWGEGRSAHLRATADDGLVVDDRTVDGGADVTVPEGGSVLWVAHGESVVEVIRRGGRLAVRVRDPQAPTRTRFTGVPVFTHDPRWVRSGVFTPESSPRTVEVSTAREDLRQRAEVVGTVEVEIDGQHHPLLATRGPGPGLTLAFHDETNVEETARWRFVSTSDPEPDGSVTVDFNRATNLPFAFTDHGTCPAPVTGNVLPLPVTAGEQRPA